MQLCMQKPLPDASFFWKRIERIIVRWGGGPYCHAMVRYPDGRSFTTGANHTMLLGWQDARYTMQQLASHKDYWDIIDLPCRVTRYVIAWCDSEVGAKYDLFGAIRSAFKHPREHPGKWMCQESSAAQMVRADHSGEIFAPGMAGAPLLIPPSPFAFWTLNNGGTLRPHDEKWLMLPWQRMD